MSGDIASGLEIKGVPLEVIRHAVPNDGDRPTVVLLHEGLGSAVQWKDFPRRLSDQLDSHVVAYSRAGYGRSGAADWPWHAGFMHDEAGQLTELIDRLDLPQPPVLVGHSDGGSIALITAAQGRIELAGLVVMAPHVFVEDVTVASIEALGPMWSDPGFRRRFSFYHRHGQALFEAWRRVWLSPEFRDWDIRPQLSHIDVPILAIQGEQDEYGTMAQIEDIARQAPQTRLLKLPECGHAPHRDQPEQVIEAIDDFVNAL